jgi:hypothetical protein
MPRPLALKGAIRDGKSVDTVQRPIPNACTAVKLRKFTSPEGGSPERGLHGDFVLRLLRKAVTVCIHGLGMHKRDEVAHVQRDFARA